MKQTETEHLMIFESDDINGNFQVRITKSQLPQLTIAQDINGFPDEAYVNVNGIELIGIRNMLNKIIKLHNWE